MNRIKKHYQEQARLYGVSKQMSMKDSITKDMEVSEIIKYLQIIKSDYPKLKLKVFEEGCGNGYTAEKITEKLSLKLFCVDFCEDLIKIAKDRKLKSVNFEVANILKLPIPDSAFHIVFTERCLINLGSWEEQKI